MDNAWNNEQFTSAYLRKLGEGLRNGTIQSNLTPQQIVQGNFTDQNLHFESGHARTYTELSQSIGTGAGQQSR
jgi:hypothetical protein